MANTKDIRANIAQYILPLQKAVHTDPRAPAPVVALAQRGEAPTDEAAATQVAQWLLMHEGLHPVLVEVMNASGLARLQVDGPRIAATSAVLRQCPHLQHLELLCSSKPEGNPTAVDTKPLLGALAANTSLRSLKIEIIQGYTRAACNDMLRAIKTHPGLTLLALAGDRDDPAATDPKVHEGLLDFIRGATALQTLELDTAGLGFKVPATIELCEALKANTRLKLSALSLRGNDLNEEVAPELIAYLESNKNLAILDISMNKPSFSKSIMKFLAHKDRCSVRSLSLGGVSWAEAESTALMIKSNETLKLLRLTIRYSMLQMHTKQVIYNALANNSTLECLVLNDFNKEESSENDPRLADALEHNNVLVSLVLGGGVVLSPEQLARLEAIVIRNRDRAAKAASVRSGVDSLAKRIATRFFLPTEIREYLGEYIFQGISDKAIDEACSVILIDSKTSAPGRHALQLVDALGNANFPLIKSICQSLKLSRADLDYVLHEAKARPGIPHDVIASIEAITVTAVGEKDSRTKDILAKLAPSDVTLLQQAAHADPAAPAPVLALAQRFEVPTDEAAATQIVQWLLRHDPLHVVLVAVMNASGLASLRVEGPHIAGTAAILQKCSQLQHLVLCSSLERDGKPTDIDTKPLISALAANTSLKSLEIEAIRGYTYTACNDMLKAIKAHPGLTLLSLQGPGLSATDPKLQEGLLDYVRSATLLQTLKLDMLGLGSDVPTTITLFEALKDNTRLALSALSLSGNRLDRKVVPQLIAYLKSNKNLVSLDISLNPAPLLIHIVPLLGQDGCSLRSLTLGIVDIAAVEAVTLMIKTNKTLKVLSLTTHLDMYQKDAKQAFFDGLANNKTLERLILDDSSRNIDPEFVNALEHNTSLAKIDFGAGMVLTPEQLARVEAIVIRNRDREAKAASVGQLRI